MRLLIYVSMLLFEDVLTGNVVEEQDVKERPEHASVAAVHERGQRTGAKREVRPSKRSRISGAAKGAVRAAGWLLNADQSTPDVQSDSQRTTSRQAKRR